MDRLAALAVAPGVFVLDLHKNLVFGDELVADAFGLEPDRLRHGTELAPLFALVEPDDREPVSAAIYADQEGFYTQTFRIKRADGTTARVRCVGYTFFDENGPVKKAGSLRVLDELAPPRRHTMYDLCLTVGQLGDEEGDPFVRYAMDTVLQHLSERE